LHRGSPGLDEDGDGSEDDDEDEDDDKNGSGHAPKTPAKTLVASSAMASTLASAIHGSKHKSMVDSIADVSAHEQANCITIVNINANPKNVHMDQQESHKRHTQLDVELARLQHQHDEAAAQRTHEALMFDKQITLELARAGHCGGAPIGYSAGGPLDNVHPSLRR
jgi:hypothetical protein